MERERGNADAWPRKMLGERDCGQMGKKTIDCPDFAHDSSMLQYMGRSGIRAC